MPRRCSAAFPHSRRAQQFCAAALQCFDQIFAAAKLFHIAAAKQKRSRQSVYNTLGFIYKTLEQTKTLKQNDLFC